MHNVLFSDNTNVYKPPSICAIYMKSGLEEEKKPNTLEKGRV